MSARSCIPTVRTRLNRFLKLEGSDCLPFQQVEVLLTIHRHQPLVVKKLAEQQRMKLKKITPLLTALATKGLIESPSGPEDTVILTKTARQGIEEATTN